MPTKSYKNQEPPQMNVAETAVEYQTAYTKSSNSWNPNVPFIGTQEEWWEHFHQIEEGEFMTLEEFDQKFAKWKKEYLANKLR